MTVTTTEYTLYGLTGKTGSTQNKGPHAFKTEVDLAILGVPAKVVPYTFLQIRTTLEQATKNPKVTVPTLQVGEDEYVTDSWTIAEWLEEHHATAHSSLFPNESKPFAKFLEVWANNDLADQLRPFGGALGYADSDPDVQTWILANKLNNDASAIEARIASVRDPAYIETQTAAARSKLQTLEKYLAALKEQGKGIFLAGSGKPSHADAVVYGWYASSQSWKEISDKIWRDDSLPLVGEWIDAVAKATGVDPKF